MEEGFILIDKSIGPTSHDIIGQLRGICHVKKIGHSGTLDPFAGGLLIAGIGRKATKNLDLFKQMSKTYIAEIKLGETSSTGDPNGEKQSGHPTNRPTIDIIRKRLQALTGERMQTPPMLSAKKIKGKRLYDLARRGLTVDRPGNLIKISKLELLEYEFPILKIRVQCSSGTYIRTLAEEIGQDFGGGWCKWLLRTEVGPYSVEKALKLELLTHQNWRDALFWPTELETTKNAQKLTHRPQSDIIQSEINN